MSHVKFRQMRKIPRLECRTMSDLEGRTTNVIDLRVFRSGDFPGSYECNSRLPEGNKSATEGNAQITEYLPSI